MAAWGLQSIDEPDDSDVDQPENLFYIWPESVKTWGIWQRLQSMWRSGLAGRDGFDWPSVTTWPTPCRPCTPWRWLRSTPGQSSAKSKRPKSPDGACGQCTSISPKRATPTPPNSKMPPSVVAPNASSSKPARELAISRLIKKPIFSNMGSS
ncbi:DUF1799 domain-containing protein [bacterium]|nr:DUF1799 domain-containing protein [bacterium]